MEVYMKIIVAFILSICSFTLCQADDSTFIPKLVVNGSCQLHKPADQLSMSISVISQAETAESGLLDNNVAMQKVVENIKMLGLEKGEYHTGQFSINPVYSQPPRYPAEDWKPKIIGYQVTNMLNIKTSKIDLTAVIIDAAGKAGADQVSNISFGIEDQKAYRTEAIAEATKNALQDATTIADIANLKLVRILDVKLDQPHHYPRPGPNVHYLAKGSESAPFIEASDVDINATVSVIFEVSSKN
jgi:uncharacterized protein YggE